MVAERKRVPEAVKEDLGERVAQLRESSRQIVRELGLLRGGTDDLSMSQCHAVVELSRRGPLSGSQLAELLMLDRSTTSRLMTALTKAGLVQGKGRRDDKRSFDYALTASGRAQARRVHAGADAQVERALRALAPEGREVALRGLELYAQALRRARLRAAVTVRPIRRADNPAVAAVIRTVMPEFGATGPGFAIVDPEVDDMFGNYRQRAAYFVAERDGVVLGGAGIAPLLGGDPDVCELKKMYLLAEARGLGVGDALITAALTAARRLKFAHCYLETLTTMQQARRLYERHGFARIEQAMGRTGHFGCNTFYLRSL